MKKIKWKGKRKLDNQYNFLRKQKERQAKYSRITRVIILHILKKELLIILYYILYVPNKKLYLYSMKYVKPCLSFWIAPFCIV